MLIALNSKMGFTKPPQEQECREENVSRYSYRKSQKRTLAAQETTPRHWQKGIHIRKLCGGGTYQQAEESANRGEKQEPLPTTHEAETSH